MRGRAGFTIVELLVVAVLGSLIVAAAYQVLMVNQRTYTVQNAQVQAQQSTRAGMDLLFAELREVSRAGQDVRGMGPDTLRIRAARNFGLACAVDVAAGTLDVRRVGSWFSQGDSVVVLAENRTNTAADDDWVHGLVLNRDTTITCGGAAAQRLTVTAVATAATSGPDTVRVGAPVRSYSYYTYGLFTIDGEPFLGRREGGGTPMPLVGPLRASSGLEFRYLDSLGAVTTNPVDVAQVEVTLRTLSSARAPNGEPVEDSLSTRVKLRN